MGRGDPGHPLGRRQLDVRRLPYYERDQFNLGKRRLEYLGRRHELEARFRTWHEWTLDLPGTYYLEVVQRLYKENRLAKASFVALGRRISLASIRVPLFLLAANDDDVVAPAQLLATKGLVSTPPEMISEATAPGGHLGLFMGATTLAQVWPKIGRWLSA